MGYISAIQALRPGEVSQSARLAVRFAAPLVPTVLHQGTAVRQNVPQGALIG